MDYSVVVTGLVCFGLGLFLFVRRNTGCRVWASPLSLVVTLVLVVLMPAASFAASTDPGQAAAPGPTAQDCLTVIVWTIAALSIAEMIRNSIQGLFTRLSGINESGFATKAVGAISGVGALFGLANLSRTTVGGFSGHSGGFSGGQRTGEINLAGVNSPLEGASLQTDGVFAGKPYGEMAGSNFSLETPGTTVGLQRASQTGNRWGESLGSFTAGAATAVVGSALSIAGAAIPDGERLAAAGKNVFSNTAGRAFGYAGAVAGRFAGTYAGLLEQSYNAKQQSGGGINIKAAFQMVTGGATAREALSRSMIFAGSHAVHPQAGQMVLEGMQGERRARLETAHTAGAAAGGPTSSLDGVRYSGDV